ncbi:MAG TPA: hypothetical protein VLS48_00545, partial [Anaerolineales bacterium]|nr:hypothetical protein [Anaerolineales bacterium]
MNAPNPSEKRTLFVTLDRYEATVAAGNSASFRIHIENQGASEEYFEIRLRGAPSDWVQLSVPPVVAIPAGQSLDATLTIRPPAPPRSQPGAFTVRVR